MNAQFFPIYDATSPSGHGHINGGLRHQDEDKHDAIVFGTNAGQAFFVSSPILMPTMIDVDYGETDMLAFHPLQNGFIARPDAQQATPQRSWSDIPPSWNMAPSPVASSSNQHSYTSGPSTVDARVFDMGLDTMTFSMAEMQFSQLHNNPALSTQGYDSFQGQSRISVPSEQTTHPVHMIDSGHDQWSTNITTLDNVKQPTIYPLSPGPKNDSISELTGLPLGPICGRLKEGKTCTYRADAATSGQAREKLLEQHLKKHQKRQHDDERIKCSFCKITFQRLDNLGAHERSKHGIGIKRAASIPVRHQVPLVLPQKRRQTR